MPPHRNSLGGRVLHDSISELDSGSLIRAIEG